MRKKALLEVYTIPASIILIVVLALVLLLLAKLLSATITVNERGGMADTALYAMLNSNDCTPNTKLAFKDVLGIGIGENKKYDWQGINLNYGGESETVTVYDCFQKMGTKLLGNAGARFHVEYPALCPPSWASIGCLVSYSGSLKDANKLNVISSEYIALPNGEVAKVVLETAA